MTPTETVTLTKYVKACCPQQAIDEYTPDVWHDLLGDLELADCRAAVVTVTRRQPFCAPAEIITEVKRARARQHEHERTEALLHPLRLRRASTDPRPLRSTIREMIEAQWHRRELTAGDQQ
jgi:hypothetical protein